MERRTRAIIHSIGRSLRVMHNPSTQPFNSIATVTAIDGSTAWVLMDGASEPMPVAMTIDCKPSDRIRILVSNSGAMITGNDTAPPTDDAEAIAARVRAQVAKDAADTAQETADAAAEAADGAAKVATNYITETGTGGITVTAEDASSEIQIADTVKVKADGSNYSEQTAEGFDVYKDGAKVAGFGDTVTIGRESGLHTVMEPDATRYIDAEGSTVIRLDKDTFDRRITGTGGAVAYTGTGATTAVRPSAAWWGRDSSAGTDGADLALDTVEGAVDADAWELATVNRWFEDGMPGTLALHVPDELFDQWGIGNYLPVGSITLSLNGDYAYGDADVASTSGAEPQCVHPSDPWIRVAGAWVDGSIALFWVNPYAYLSDSPDDSGVEYVARLARAAYADVDGNPIADTYAKTTDLDGYYELPEDGIPASDLADGVRASLGLADTALQAVDGLEPGRALISGENGDPQVSSTTSTELYRLHGIRSNVQDQIDAVQSAAGLDHIPYAAVDSTSTSTAFTATVEGVTALKDGVAVLLRNGVVTSAAGFTVDVNGLGAKPVYTNLAAATAETTKFNVNYTLLFVYDSTRVTGGCWVCYNGYDSNTNSIGYQLRTNYSTRVAADKGYRYRLWFTSADGTEWVPANTSTATNATTPRPLNARPIDPFGDIAYCSTNATTEAGAALTATALWQQYPLNVGYSYMQSGFSLSYPAPVYVRCTPQDDGSAVMDAIVQSLPSSADGRIYIYLGRAYGASNMELVLNHPVYYHDGDGVREWGGMDRIGESEINALFAAAV